MHQDGSMVSSVLKVLSDDEIRVIDGNGYQKVVAVLSEDRIWKITYDECECATCMTEKRTTILQKVR